jgi:hypothetical protein
MPESIIFRSTVSLEDAGPSVQMILVLTMIRSSLHGIVLPQIEAISTLAERWGGFQGRPLSAEDGWALPLGRQYNLLNLTSPFSLSIPMFQ